MWENLKNHNETIFLHYGYRIMKPEWVDESETEPVKPKIDEGSSKYAKDQVEKTNGSTLAKTQNRKPSKGELTKAQNRKPSKGELTKAQNEEQSSIQPKKANMAAVENTAKSGSGALQKGNFETRSSDKITKLIKAIKKNCKKLWEGLSRK